MNLAGLLLVVVLLTAGIISLAVSRDTFSPAKFYLASFVVFFGGAAFGEWSAGAWFLAFLTGLMCAVLLVFEGQLPTLNSNSNLMKSVESKDSGPPVRRAAVLFIWLITLPAMLAQAYLVLNFGGLEGYINIVGHRVQEFRGYGPITTIASTYLIVNLLYFGYLLRCSAGLIHWFGFVLHFSFLIGIGVLTSSRGGMLNAIVLLLIIFHYQKRPVSLPAAGTVAIILILLAGVIGTIRENVKIDEGQLQTGLDFSDTLFKEGTLSAGMISLDILANTDRALRYGSTFLSVLTNPIPREWWPEKPDTGGVVFTYDYALDEWRGLSNLTPTIIGEFIINFGWTFGIALFLIVYGWAMLSLIRYYRRIVIATNMARRPDDLFFGVVFYVLFLWMIVALMAGEVTNTITPYIVSKVLPLLLIRYCFGYFGFIRLESTIFHPNRVRIS